MQQPLNNDTTRLEDAQEQPNFFTEIKDRLQAYISDRITLVKLQVVQKISVVAAAIISGILLVVFGLFLLIFVSITLGFLFSHWLNSYAAGFGIVAGIYLLLLLMVVFFGKKLFGNAVTNKLIQNFLKKK
ncbi:MAG: phage holin family protein [Bacteroidota bacterium]|nr:phage holin family protein [Bacteroidota bacterium]